MILDSLSNSSNYESINPYFKQAFEFIKKTDWSKQELGKIYLDGDNCYINYMEADGKSSETARFESHKAYLDIQVPITATEQIGFIPTCELNEPEAPYNAEKDIIFYKDKGDVLITVKPMHFTVFWPWDGHQPCIGQGKWRKLVVKIKL